MELEKTAEKAPKADIQTAKGKGKKQSVLQALRERQAKLKAQETGQTEQKNTGTQKRRTGIMMKKFEQDECLLMAICQEDTCEQTKEEMKKILRF